MLFVAQGTFKDASDPIDRAAHRLDWDYLSNVNVVGEYWTGTGTVAIFETDDPAVIFELLGYWEPHISFTVAPVVSAEDGLKILRARMSA